MNTLIVMPSVASDRVFAGIFHRIVANFVYLYDGKIYQNWTADDVCEKIGEAASELVYCVLG